MRDIVAGSAGIGFTLQLALWLWFTVLFANFAEAMAEGRGKAQADALRAPRMQTRAKRLREPGNHLDFLSVFATELRRGDLVLVQAGDLIPADGEVVEGVASVDESAITGESAPVIRESGGDRSAVTGGTRVLSDWLVVRVTANPGETFIDRMIALVEGAIRQKTPNEIALTILLSGLTVVFLLAVVTLQPFAIYSGGEAARPGADRAARLPDPDHDRRAALGHRHRGDGPADPAERDRDERPRGRGGGRRQHAAARQDRHDHAGQPPGGGVPPGRRRPGRGAGRPGAARVAPGRDAGGPQHRGAGQGALRLRGRAAGGGDGPAPMTFVPFSAATRMSGVNVAGRQLRKGATDAIGRWVAEAGGSVPPETEPGRRVHRPPGRHAAGRRGAPRTEPCTVLGVVHLKDVVKGGMKERFDRLRAMGIRTVMITGDNPLTAAAIAAEAGVDDFLAEATPEQKLELIRKEQAGGRLVAMTGDGTNDAPALAQADVGVAMNSGTQAAREAGQHGGPRLQPDQAHRGRGDREAAADDAGLADHVLHRQRRRQVLRDHSGDVRGDLSRSSGALNIMRLHSPQSAILSSVIFNALIIIALIPLALRGVSYRPAPASVILRRNLLDLRRRRPPGPVRRASS